MVSANVGPAGARLPAVLALPYPQFCTSVWMVALNAPPG